MGRESEWGQYIRDRVEAGPVRLAALVAEAADLVPPGRAFRTVVRTVEHRRESANASERNYVDQQAKKDQRIRYGQRGYVTNLIHSLSVRGRIEVFEQDGERWVRLGKHPWSDPAPIRSELTPYSRAILQLVESDTYTYEEVFEVVRDMIPADRAIDVARRNREHNRARRSSTASATFPEDHDRSLGARTLFTSAVLNLKRSGRVVVSGDGMGRTIGRGPTWRHPE